MSIKLFSLQEFCSDEFIYHVVDNSGFVLKAFDTFAEAHAYLHGRV